MIADLMGPLVAAHHLQYLPCLAAVTMVAELSEIAALADTAQMSDYYSLGVAVAAE